MRYRWDPKDPKLRGFLMALVLILVLVQQFGLFSVDVSDSDQEKITGQGYWITGERDRRDGLYRQCEGTDELIFFSYSQASYIDVYDRTGVYQYTIHLTEDSQNGAMLIDCRDDLLIAQSKGGVVFVFRGQELVERLTREEAKERGVYLRSGDQDSRYGITESHVVEIDGETLTPLFPLPPEIEENLPLFTISDEVIWVLLVVGFGVAVAFIAVLAVRRVRWLIQDRRKWQEFL